MMIIKCDSSNFNRTYLHICHQLINDLNLFLDFFFISLSDSTEFHEIGKEEEGKGCIFFGKLHLTQKSQPYPILYFYLVIRLGITTVLFVGDVLIGCYNIT